MSGNADKQDASKEGAGSRVLKKARSFKDDIKSRISRRTPSATRGEDCTPTKPSPQHSRKSPKHPKKKGLQRGQSFNAGSSKTEKTKKKSNADRLEAESRKVFQALGYLQDVIQKNTLQMLSGSATIVLETIMEFSQLCDNYFVNEESSALSATYHQVHQCLADLIRLADVILLRGDNALDKEAAMELIGTLRQGVKDLVNLSVDHLQRRASQNAAMNGGTKRSASTGIHDQSLPLELSTPEPSTTDESNSLGPNYHALSRSADDILGQAEEDSPPPKPPLPHRWSNTSTGGEEEVVSHPPPLPIKRRTSSSRDELSPMHLLPSPQPSHSTCSSMSVSSDEVESSHSSLHASPVKADPRFSSYDNISANPINTLTEKIQQLTTDIHGPISVSELLNRPPPLPDKEKRGTCDSMTTHRTLSAQPSASPRATCTMRTSHSMGFTSSSSSKVTYRASTSSALISRSVHMTLSKETFSSSETYLSTTSSSSSSSDGVVPDLPPKKKHVEAYMQIFGECDSSAQDHALSRHSLHSVRFYQQQWRQHQEDLFLPPSYPRSNTLSVLSDVANGADALSITSASSNEDMPTPRPRGGSEAFGPMLPPKQRRSLPTSTDPTPHSLTVFKDPNEDSAVETDSKSSDSSSEKRNSAPISSASSSASSNRNSSPLPEKDLDDYSLLDEVDVADHLVVKKEGEDGPNIRGGPGEALLVHATAAGRNDFMYQEAFLTTYRTFISSKELIQKLLRRYTRFSRSKDPKRKKLSKNAFSLLIRVVDELCTELDETLVQVLMELVFQLLCDGELMLAKIFREKVLEKFRHHQLRKERSRHVKEKLLSSLQVSLKPHTLLDFKPEQVAEQMTLLDAELFLTIEIPELLLYSKNQSEEHSPHLTQFTEHFNKMSYWCCTRILEQEDPREREKYFVRFIKVMKHLRKINNFNSYLAILSALNSSPISRLEWQKQNSEALQELSQLIDSSGSFRTYRQALAETSPPCIPYIGIILQDLTFIHIGNPDNFSDGNINFAKRWQQFNILDSMRRFKMNYDFKESSKILAMFNNFEDYLSEESLWQISKKIKP